MNIELTKEEYERLLKVVYAGNWMLNGLREDPLEEYIEIEQKIFAASRELKGGTDQLRWDKKYHQFLPSEKLESEMDEFLQDYDENIFWNELIHRLAARDVLEQFGEDAVENMDETEENEHLAAFSETYESHFEERGILDLKISGT